MDLNILYPFGSVPSRPRNGTLGESNGLGPKTVAQRSRCRRVGEPIRAKAPATVNRIVRFRKSKIPGRDAVTIHHASEMAEREGTRLVAG